MQILRIDREYQSFHEKYYFWWQCIKSAEDSCIHIYEQIKKVYIWYIFFFFI